MSKIALYNALERIIAAAGSNNYREVRIVNDEFSRLLRQEFSHLPNWSTDEKVLMYDKCANSAVYSVTQGPAAREEHLQRMRERFSKIPKPK